MPGIQGDTRVTTDPVMGGNLSAGQDWGSFLASLFSGYTALKGTDVKNAKEAANVADPYMGQYSQWQPKIVDLMKDPSSFLKDPMFTNPLKLGGESVARQFGASGMGLSGNEDAALQQYGQSFGNQYLQQQLGNLMTLGGVNKGSPAAAGGLLAQGQHDQTKAGSAGLTGLGGILGSLLGLGPGATMQSIMNAIKGFGGGGSGGLGGDNSGAPPSGTTPGNTPGYVGSPTDTTTIDDPIIPEDPTAPGYIDWGSGGSGNVGDWTNNFDWSQLGSDFSFGP